MTQPNVANDTSFASLFTPRQVICRTEIGDRDEIIRELVQLLGPALQSGGQCVCVCWTTGLGRCIAWASISRDDDGVNQAFGALEDSSRGRDVDVLIRGRPRAHERLLTNTE